MEQPTAIAEVTAGIRDVLATGAAPHIDEVAARLYVSKSTLQRRLDLHGTTFTALRRHVQVQVAIERLCDGASCAMAARCAGVSPDHLCRLISREVGLQPRKMARACELARRAERWRRSIPPRAGTRLYIDRLRKWKALEAEIVLLLAPIPAARHPLAPWARKLRRAAKRPDYRRGSYRARAHGARNRERLERARQRRRAEAFWARFERSNYWAQMIGAEAPDTPASSWIEVEEIFRTWPTTLQGRAA